MSSGFVWVTSPSFAFRGLMDSYEEYVIQVVFEMLRQRAPEITAWMKANAPWTDRTGNARRSLIAEAMAAVGQKVLALELRYGPRGGEVEYAKYLEYSHAGRYSIIAPAIDYWAPVILADVQAALR